MTESARVKSSWSRKWPHEYASESKARDGWLLDIFVVFLDRFWFCLISSESIVVFNACYSRLREVLLL